MTYQTPSLQGAVQDWSSGLTLGAASPRLSLKMTLCRNFAEGGQRRLLFSLGPLNLHLTDEPGNQPFHLLLLHSVGLHQVDPALRRVMGVAFPLLPCPEVGANRQISASVSR